jgi:hypothetical protein
VSGFCESSELGIFAEIDLERKVRVPDAQTGHLAPWFQAGGEMTQAAVGTWNLNLPGGASEFGEFGDLPNSATLLADHRTGDDRRASQIFIHVH